MESGCGFSVAVGIGVVVDVAVGDGIIVGEAVTGGVALAVALGVGVLPLKEQDAKKRLMMAKLKRKRDFFIILGYIIPFFSFPTRKSGISRVSSSSTPS